MGELLDHAERMTTSTDDDFAPRQMCDVWRLEIGIVRRTAELGIAYLQPPLPPAIALDRYLFNVSISQSYSAVPGATYRMGRLRKALTFRACFEAASP